MKTREEVLVQAYDECLRDLYLNSEPPVDIKELIDSGFKDDENGPFLFDDKETAVPPWATLRTLEEASRNFENEENLLNEKCIEEKQNS